MTIESALIGHWPLARDGEDHSGHGHHATLSGARFVTDDGHGCTEFDYDGGAVVPAAALTPSAGGPFSISAWVRLPESLPDVGGTIASSFDTGRRRGFELGVQHAISTTSQNNTRNLEFGVDWGSEPAWEDCGRPGDSVAVWAFAVHEGLLYAGTLGADDRGHVWSWDGRAWSDLGTVGEANSISSLASYDGALYAAATRYRTGGSALPESANDAPGGDIWRYTRDEGWQPAGRLDGADSVSGFAIQGGQLFASALYQRGVFRLVGHDHWEPCGDPGRRLLALGVFRGRLLGAGNDHVDVSDAIDKTRAGIVIEPDESAGGGGVFAWEQPDTWHSLGMQPQTTQVYSLGVYQGALYASTWPNGLVFRWEGDQRWQDVGRLGDETEVMGLIAYNGALYGGTLPHAELHRFDGPGDWRRVGTLDVTPDVRYRRAATLAVYQGRLWCGTLPSGHAHAMRTGAVATHDSALSGRWHHVVGRCDADGVSLFVDGVEVGRQHGVGGLGSLASGRDLLLGNGTRERFAGRMRDVRLYREALSGSRIAQLAAERAGTADPGH